MMNYYNISFNVYSPDGFLDYPNGSEKSKKIMENLVNAEREAKSVLDRLSLENVFAYSWTNGSLFRYVRTRGEDNPRKLQETIEHQIRVLINRKEIKNITNGVRIFAASPNQSAQCAPTLEAWFDTCCGKEIEHEREVK